MPMPSIKGLKIGRRKSSGAAIVEDNSIPAPSGFRVLPRNETAKRSVGGPLQDRKSPSDHLKSSNTWSEEDTSSSNRGSGSSAATSARSRIFDSTSPRFSSSSVSQSPSELPRKEPAPTRAQRSKTQGFLNFSDDLDSADGFGDLFSGFAHRRSAYLDDAALAKPPAPAVVRAESEPFLSNPPNTWTSARTTATPPPSNTKRPDPIQSPYSWNSRTSYDGLMSSPGSDRSPGRDQPSPAPLKSVSPSHDPYKDKLGSQYLEANKSSTNLLGRSESFSRSGADEDMDAKIVRQSFLASRRSNGLDLSVLADRTIKRKSVAPQGSHGMSSDSSLNTPSMSSSGSSTQAEGTIVAGSANSANVRSYNATSSSQAASSNNTTPRAVPSEPVKRVDSEDPSIFDSSIVHAIRAAGKGSDFTSSRPSYHDEPKKVMTAAQFEDLRKRSTYDVAKGKKTVETDSEDDYEDDEDDEAALAAKRRAQADKEAQHAVWRQRMKKEIGDHSSPLPPRPGANRSSISTPNLSINLPTIPPALSDAGGSGANSEDDDEVPLGILQAHNFPNKTNPPDSRFSSNSFVAPRPASTLGTNNGRPPSSLPVFARKLPQDPYIGASDMANGLNRESVVLNRQSNLAAASPVPNLPPGGLIGVIAEEERQRNMRRGSPNPPPGGGALPGMGPPMPGMPNGAGAMGIPGMGSMPMLPMLSIPGQNAEQQNQINQQLVQLIQQQNMMIQHMYASSMGVPSEPFGGSQAPGTPTPGGAAMSVANGFSPARGPMQSRTMSMLNVQPPAAQPRTMSMMNLQRPNFMPAWSGQEPLISGAGSVKGLGLQGPGGGYAPSVAPSERSNVGQPSRYKPVTNSVLIDSGSMYGGPTAKADDLKKKKGFLSAIINPKGKVAAGGTEDDDDDWGSFARKRRSVMPKKTF